MGAVDWQTWRELKEVKMITSPLYFIKKQNEKDWEMQAWVLCVC